MNYIDKKQPFAFEFPDGTKITLEFPKQRMLVQPPIDKTIHVDTVKKLYWS